MKWLAIFLIAVIFLSGISQIPHIQNIEFVDRLALKNLLALPRIPIGNETIDIAFLGDAMFDRHIRAKANSTSYDNILKPVASTLNAFDFVVMNLEGPITTNPTKSTYNQNDPNHYVFTFDPEVIKTLTKSNVSIVNLDNNHILNFSSEGLRETKELLGKSEVKYFGDPSDRKPVYEKINDVDFAFISFNQFIRPDGDETIRQIKEAKENEREPFVVIYTHWGEEYKIEPNQYQINLARSFIDNGADIVIGSHPHVVQEKETYNGKQIYYSLGNFVFDQYFSDDVRCGAIVVVKVSPRDKSYTTQEFFTRLEPSGQTTLSDCLLEVPTMNSNPA